MPRHHVKKRAHKSKKDDVQDDGDQPAYIVRSSDEMGRYLVANRDMDEGTLIIREDALVVGPAQDSVPVCLGCYSPTTLRCEKCQWPICSSKCKGLFKTMGHSQEECRQLKDCNMNSSRLPQCHLMNAITPLRCLLLREHQPHKWSKLITMESHDDIRRKIPSIWEYNQITVVNRIRDEWSITKYSADIIHQVCGILEVNAFDVGSELKNIRGLYPTSFLISHSCVPNTSHTNDDQFNMKIFTSVPVRKHQTITLSYTLSLQDTKKRRLHLKRCKFFECSCDRCKDPTELGSYLNAIKCEKCISGHLLPSDPLGDDTPWVCDNQHCHATRTAVDVDAEINRIGNNIETVDHNNIESLENTIKLYEHILHKNHYININLKYTLSQLYGKSAGYLVHQMSVAMLNRKKEICEDLLTVFDIIEPGLTTIRGLTMYELHAPIIILAIQQFQNDTISKTDLRKLLKKVSYYLRGCVNILKFESISSEEGQVKAAAESAILQLKSWEPVVGEI